MPTSFRVKRIYEHPAQDDGYRILVDRLWPRGVKKADARVDLWAKDFAPSSALRTWYHVHIDRQREFATKYRQELRENQSEIEATLAEIDQATITLLTAVKDPETGHAPVLRKFLAGLSA
jgi:uncharacterized protein YeaO (DUF488 family)